jgi:hypothetical protein
VLFGEERLSALYVLYVSGQHDLTCIFYVAGVFREGSIDLRV